MAMTGGFVLGERQRDEQRVNSNGPLESGAAAQPSTSGFEPPGPFCLQAARDMAEDQGYTTELWQVLKVYADRTNSTWWICTDAQGGLYYQSWTNVSNPLVQGKNALFLPGVKRIGKDSYQVQAPDGNIFAISSTRFTLTYRSGAEPQRDDVRPID